MKNERAMCLLCCECFCDTNTFALVCLCLCVRVCVLLSSLPVFSCTLTERHDYARPLKATHRNSFNANTLFDKMFSLDFAMWHATNFRIYQISFCVPFRHVRKKQHQQQQKIYQITHAHQLKKQTQKKLKRFW